MPFVNRFEGLITPKRVYSLCKLVQLDKYNKEELKQFFEPDSLNEKGEKFYDILAFAKAGELIKEDQDGICCIAENGELESLDNFRRAVNKRAFRKSDLTFCKFTGWYIARGKKVFEDSSSAELMGSFYNEITKPVNDKNEFNETNINAWKYWASFMGLGFLTPGQKGDIFVPNASVRVQDSLEEHDDIEHGKKISIRKFIEWLSARCPELDYGTIFMANRGDAKIEENRISAALSAALRFLHDKQKIELLDIPDSSDKWYLEYSGGHKFTSRVTDIVIGG